MNPLTVIMLAAMGVIGSFGLAALPPESQFEQVTPYVDPWGDLPLEALQTRQEPATTTTTAPLGICPPVYETALLVGFTPDEAALLDRIAWHESRCIADIRGDLTKGVSHGILQIHGPSWCEPNRWWPRGYLQAKGVLDTCADLYDPVVAVIAAKFIVAEQGFEAWTTYEKALHG